MMSKNQAIEEPTYKANEWRRKERMQKKQLKKKPG